MYTKSKRRGFTLVELLIVIVVIGVLAAMMMLSSTESVSSAKATKVINDLMVLKKAVISWYVDNYDRVVKNKEGHYLVKAKTGNGEWYLGQFAKDYGGEKEFVKYLGTTTPIKLTKDNSTKPGEYLLATEGNLWFVGYDTGTDMKLREKLADRAKSLKLKGATKQTNSDGSLGVNTDNIHPYTVNDPKVYMLIMTF